MRIGFPHWFSSRTGVRCEESLRGCLSGIGTQVTLFAVVSVALTALLVGAVVYTGLTRLMEKEAMASLNQTTELAATRLESTFETLRQDVRILANMPPIEGMLAAQRLPSTPVRCAEVDLWQGRLVRLFSEMLRNKSQYREARFYAADGRELVAVLQLDGEIISSLPPQRCENVRHLRADTVAVEAEKGVRLSRADADDGIGASIVRATMVVHDRAGRVRGKVTLDLHLQKALTAQHAGDGLARGLRFYVTDEHGHFLLPEAESLPPTFFTMFPEFAPVFGQAASPPSMFVRHADAVDTAIHFRKVPLDAPEGVQFIGLAFAGSFEAITAGSRAVVRDSAVIIVMLSVLAGVFAAWMVQIVVRPIRKLNQAARAVAEGNGSVELPLATRNEIGVLARSFKLMLDRLKQREAALARRAAQLDRVNGELRELIYVMAHDLRAPLRAVSGLASILEEDLGPQLDADSAQNMDALRARVRRMDEFIDALLAFSRAGLVGGAAETVDVGALLRDVASMLGVHQRMDLHLPEYLPRLVTDRVRLTQVFANLIDNAIKHRKEPRGNIWIGVRELPGETYQFSVRDDGPGIAAEDHRKIFGMFQTLNPQSTGECAGVGLAIVKKIVESVGGRVWVDSKLGRGATFYFTWPKRCADGEHAPNMIEGTIEGMTGDTREAGSPAILES